MQNEFVSFLLDQLAPLEGLRAIRMFGAYGLYRYERFFGIVADEVLYLKTDATSVQRYIERGMGPIQVTETQVLKNYYQVPSDVLEDTAELCEWVMQAVERANAPKPKKGKKKAETGDSFFEP